MALPKLDTPIHSMTLPSTGEEIKYRPFLVKEQKLMLMAQDSKDTDETYNNLKAIIDACTFSKLDIENSPIFDVEYMFLKVRSKSVGSKANINVICPDDEKTSQMVSKELGTAGDPYSPIIGGARGALVQSLVGPGEP